MAERLPIYEIESEIIARLKQDRRLILSAPTGSGKSTQVPQMLLRHGLLGAGQVVILRIRNDDATAEEFDSAPLKTEKVVAGGYTASVRLRPLAPGRYAFMGEYHPGTAQGFVIAE